MPPINNRRTAGPTIESSLKDFTFLTGVDIAGQLREDDAAADRKQVSSPILSYKNVRRALPWDELLHVENDQVWITMNR